VWRCPELFRIALEGWTDHVTNRLIVKAGAVRRQLPAGPLDRTDVRYRPILLKSSGAPASASNQGMFWRNFDTNSLEVNSPGLFVSPPRREPSFSKE
jgi:hypothetical protein